MNTQINVRLPKTLLKKAQTFSQKNGYSNVQELIRESIRDKIDPELTPEEHFFLTKMVEGIEQGKVPLGTEKDLFKVLGAKK
ncbi:MAG: ribbon-helix-helix domain-containing protein [Candidatus ainarchaeum sp.]|nr:ribbon-helix-helix domain-containing protein [Candidatus ainarchaeum sp.]